MILPPVREPGVAGRSRARGRAGRGTRRPERSSFPVNRSRLRRSASRSVSSAASGLPPPARDASCPPAAVSRTASPAESSKRKLSGRRQVFREVESTRALLRVQKVAVPVGRVRVGAVAPKDDRGHVPIWMKPHEAARLRLRLEAKRRILVVQRVGVAPRQKRANRQRRGTRPRRQPPRHGRRRAQPLGTKSLLRDLRAVFDRAYVAARPRLQAQVRTRRRNPSGRDHAGAVGPPAQPQSARPESRPRRRARRPARIGRSAAVAPSAAAHGSAACECRRPFRRRIPPARRPRAIRGSCRGSRAQAYSRFGTSSAAQTVTIDSNIPSATQSRSHRKS